MNTWGNAVKKIKRSSLNVMLAVSVLISALTLAPLAGGKLIPHITPPCETLGAAEQMKLPPDADPAVERSGDEVVTGTPAGLVGLIVLVEFYSRKYIKFALDYLLEFLDSLGVFPSEDLASNLNPVDRDVALLPVAFLPVALLKVGDGADV